MEQAALPPGEVAPPGLDFAPDAISAAEGDALVSEIGRLDLPHFVFQRWTSRRRTRSFGYAYDFRDRCFAESEPTPDFLLPLRQRAAVFAGVSEASLVQVSVISYEPGAGIGWHVDRPELGAVIGVSLGAAATMRFRRKVDGAYRRAAKLLPPCSIYHLAGEVRPCSETPCQVIVRSHRNAEPHFASRRGGRAAEHRMDLRDNGRASATAAATRLVEPARTSPTAKIRGRLVCSGSTIGCAAMSDIAAPARRPR